MRPRFASMLCRLLLAGGIALGLPRTAHALWPHEPAINMPVCTAADMQLGLAMVPDGSGGAIVTWQDRRSGTSSDIYAQHLLGTGGTDPAWPADGRVLSSAARDQAAPSIAGDGAGGAIVAWQDDRGLGQPDIYAQHVRADGTVDPAWPVNGRALCVAGDFQRYPAAVSDGFGGAIVTWEDSRSGAVDIYAQRVLAGGAVDPAWPVDGRALCTAAGTQDRAVIVGDGAGGAIVAWNDARGGAGGDIYAQRIRATGTVDPAWPANGRGVATAAGVQASPLLVTDGAGGAVIAWLDLAPATYGTHAQHLRAAGTLDPAWPVDGRALNSGVTPEVSVLVSDGAGGAIAAWNDFRNSGSTGEDLFAQHVLAGGALDAAWPVNGRTVCAAPFAQYAPAIVADGLGGALVAWYDGRNGLDFDIYAQHVQAQGTLDPEWPVDGRVVSSATGDQMFPVLAADGSGGAFFTWTDTRFGAVADIYAQTISRTGYLGNPSPLGGFPVSLFSAPNSHPALANLEGTGRLDIVFGDLSSHLQVFRADGSPMPGWPTTLPGGHALAKGPIAIADLDGDRLADIVAGSSDGRVYGFRANGTPLPGFALDTGTSAPVFVSLGQLTANPARRQLVVCSGARLATYDWNGTTLALLHAVTISGSATIEFPAAIGDLDGVGQRNIVVAAGARIIGYDANLNLVFTATMPLPSPARISDAPTLADLDLDGTLWIGVPGSDGQAFVCDNRGNMRPGWPVVDPLGGATTSLAFANLLGTGEPEVTFAFSGGATHLVFRSGAETATWPRDSGVNPVPPIVEPLEGSSPDVITASADHRAFAWRNFFQPAGGWPLTLGARVSYASATGDLDGDGFVDVVFLTDTQLNVFRPGAAMGTGNPLGRWPMYANNAARTGCLACEPAQLLSGAGETPAPALGFLPPTPNPSAGAVSLGFTMERPGHARLAVFDVAGRLQRVLADEEFEAGARSLAWDARDDAGRAVASGVYFARLTFGGAGGGRTVARRFQIVR